MSPLRFLVRVGIAAAIGGLSVMSATTAQAGTAERPAGTHIQYLSIAIHGGDWIREANFALAPGVPVRLAVTNFTNEFHTFTIPGLKVSALIRPSVGQAPTTTVVTFTAHAAGAFRWHCVICPSGAHGPRHVMAGTAYVIIDPRALP